MFKSPTPPRPVINTTVISSPIPIKLPYHPVFTQKGPYKPTSAPAPSHRQYPNLSTSISESLQEEEGQGGP